MIKLLVVDDSPLMRRLLGDLFAAEGDFAVSFARDGLEALEALNVVEPDVITLDVQMPQMDGIACLDRIMLERPTPVVMASSLTAPGAETALQALELGAVDVIGKPSGAISLRMDEFGPQLVEAVRAAAVARLPQALRLRERLRARSGRGPARPKAPPRASSRPAPPAGGWRAGEGVVVVGASTGGPPALDVLLGGLPPDFPWPIIVAQHMPATFTGALARRLDGLTPLAVREVAQPTRLRPGEVHIARGNGDVLVSVRQGVLTVLGAPPAADLRWHPSVDRLVESVLAQVPAREIVGVLLTGMGNDGAAAMTRLRAAGGHTIAQSEASAVVWGMPGALVQAQGASEVLDIEHIGAALVRAVSA